MSNGNRFWVHFAFVYTCVEGLIVNITYPNVIAYLVKDVVILYLYFALLTERRPATGSLRSLVPGLLVFGGMMLLFLVVPTRVSWISAMVALKQRLFYIPLIYLGYFYLRTDADWIRLFRLLALTAVPTSLFGVYLFFQGPTALQGLGGTYAAVLHTIAGESGIENWRVPGSFTSAGQFGLYLLVQSLVMTSVLFMPRLPGRTKLFSAIALACSLAAMLASGSRAPLVMYVMSVGLGLAAMGRLTRLGIAALVGYVALTVAFMFFGAGVEDRVGSIFTEENYYRIRSTAFGGLFYDHLMAQPLGQGLGVATLAGRHFTDWTKLVFTESYFGILSIETGILGFAAFVWAMLQTVRCLSRQRVIMKRSQTAPIWYFMVVFLLQIIAFMPSSTVIDSSPGNLYFWFFLGMAIRLGDLAALPTAARVYEPPRATVPQFAFQSSWQERQ